MKITTEKLKELLVRPGHISQADFELAVKEAEKQEKDLENVLVEKELIKDEQIGKLIAEAQGFKFISLKQEKIDEKILNLIPELVARSKGIIIFSEASEGVKVGMRNPDDLESIHLVEKKTGQEVLPHYITQRDLQEALVRYEASLKDEFQDILNQLKDETKSREERDDIIIRIVDLLLRYGYQSKASDIHIEPFAEKALVRFRIDGILHDILDIPKDLVDLVLMRIKVMAKMRTDEHRAAQDGKLRYVIDREKIDVRVSIVPVTEGENIVMRILSSQNRQFSLVSLGFSPRDLQKVEKTIKNPHGMVLSTGPTGCGKTTSLYAVMKILNQREVHISTIEDPVEYDIAGISQIQVNSKTNLTFAKGLRAIVRQDPDIIMVGEIRDEETAGIAVNSALTGHLVLSTLHTNNAATTLPRLLDMGIEPFLVASTVNVVIAQRLVRKICEKCRASYQLTKKEELFLESESNIKAVFTAKGFKNLKKISLYKGNGCGACGNTGYAGRIGLFELLEMADNIKDLILKHASSDEIMVVARKNGMTTMLEDGIDKALQGVITLEEILRVTRE